MFHMTVTKYEITRFVHILIKIFIEFKITSNFLEIQNCEENFLLFYVEMQFLNY